MLTIFFPTQTSLVDVYSKANQFGFFFIVSTKDIYRKVDNATLRGKIGDMYANLTYTYKD